MEKPAQPVFEIQGEMHGKPGEQTAIFLEFFNSLEEAAAYGEANMDEYVIHMRMKLAEKRRK